MKKWLSMLASVGLVTSTISPIVSCVTNENVDKPIRPDIFRNYVKTLNKRNHQTNHLNDTHQKTQKMVV